MEWTDGQTNKYRDRKAERQRDRRTAGRTYRQTDKQTDGQAGKKAQMAIHCSKSTSNAGTEGLQHTWPSNLFDYTPVNVAWLILHLCQHIRLFSLVVRHTEQGIHAPASSCQVQDHVESQPCLLIPLYMRGRKVALCRQQTSHGGKY